MPQRAARPRDVNAASRWSANWVSLWKMLMRLVPTAGPARLDNKRHRHFAVRCLRLELCSPGASGLDVGLIIDTAQAEARRDSIAGAEPLRRAQLSVAKDRPQLRIEP